MYIEPPLSKSSWSPSVKLKKSLKADTIKYAIFNAVVCEDFDKFLVNNFKTFVGKKHLAKIKAILYAESENDKKLTFVFWHCHTLNINKDNMNTIS